MRLQRIATCVLLVSLHLYMLPSITLCISISVNIVETKVNERYVNIYLNKLLPYTYRQSHRISSSIA